MRAPMQVLVIPYIIKEDGPLFCVLQRSDANYWQFIAGGGEDNETPIQAAQRETFEEIGANLTSEIYQLEFMTYVPADCISERHRKYWPKDTYILPEYSFAIKLETECIYTSSEHNKYCWATFEQSKSILHWQSNAVALHELNERIKNNDF